MSINEIGELCISIRDFIISLNWKGILENLITALVVSGFGYLISKKITRDFRIAKEMKSYGINGVVAMKKHTRLEVKDLCKNAERLDLLFISGKGFFLENEDILKSAMDRGMKIRFLCSQVGATFLSDLEQLELRNKSREVGTNISDEIRMISEKYRDYVKEGKMEIRYYSTEYRLPFMLVYKKKKNVRTTKAFLRVTLPPYNWEKNFVLVGERSTTQKDRFFKTNEGEFNLISMMEGHFDCVWEVANDKLVENNSAI